MSKTSISSALINPKSGTKGQSLIPPNYISRIYLLLHIAQTIVETIGDDRKIGFYRLLHQIYSSFIQTSHKPPYKYPDYRCRT